jgi:hypothetical protein
VSPGRFGNHRRQSVSSRSRSNPGPARSARRNLDRRIAEHRALAGNRVPDRNRCSNWPPACNDTRQSGNCLQAKLIVLAAALPPQNAEFLSLLQLHYSSEVANWLISRCQWGWGHHETL